MFYKLTGFSSTFLHLSSEGLLNALFDVFALGGCIYFVLGHVVEQIRYELPDQYDEEASFRSKMGSGTLARPEDSGFQPLSGLFPAKKS